MLLTSQTVYNCVTPDKTLPLSRLWLSLMERQYTLCSLQGALRHWGSLILCADAQMHFVPTIPRAKRVLLLLLLLSELHVPVADFRCLVMDAPPGWVHRPLREETGMDALGSPAEDTSCEFPRMQKGAL